MLLDMKKRLYKRSLAKHTERDVSKRVSTQILSIRLSLRFFLFHYNLNISHDKQEEIRLWYVRVMKSIKIP